MQIFGCYSVLVDNAQISTFDYPSHPIANNTTQLPHNKFKTQKDHLKSDSCSHKKTFFLQGKPLQNFLQYSPVSRMRTFKAQLQCTDSIYQSYGILCPFMRIPFEIGPFQAQSCAYFRIKDGTLPIRWPTYASLFYRRSLFAQRST